LKLIKALISQAGNQFGRRTPRTRKPRDPDMPWRMIEYYFLIARQRGPRGIQP